MWKIAVGFVAFAVIVLSVLMKSGADIDMSGEKHGLETPEPAAPAASTPK
ncbi:MAG TPA: hypothetical protein VLI72_13435 [Methylibium sp.]|nr:hypothetical protein [Methylibium sp.]